VLQTPQQVQQRHLIGAKSDRSLRRRLRPALQDFGQL
jgi:hypothetical protein